MHHTWAILSIRPIFIPPATKLGGVYWIHPVCLSVCPSVCLSVCLSVCSLTFRVRPVASTVQDGFFPYMVQMINSMRGCVACDDPWPWPISSRSFGLDLENHVRSVASTVLNGFFSYMAQMINIIRGCVACYICFRICKFEFLANLKKIFPYLVQMITSMRRCVTCDDLWPWPISSRSFDLDLENGVRSVASAVLDGFFLYLAQMITIIRGCVVYYVFCRICKFQFLANFWNFSALTMKKKLQFSMDSFHM